MKISFIGAMIALLMTMAFGQGQREQLVTCLQQNGDLQMEVRSLKQDLERARTDLEAANRRSGGAGGQAANSAEIERDRARMDAERQKARADSLERRVNELAPVAAQAQRLEENLKTLVAENARLVAEAGVRQGAAAPIVVATPTFAYPVCGTITAIQVINHQGVQVIQTDFSFTNMGSRSISSFDGTAKFFSQGNLIFETPLQNVRQSGGAPVARNGSFPFRIGIPITVQSQQLPSLRPEMIDLVIEITRVQ